MELLHCTPETDLMFNVNYISIKEEDEKDVGLISGLRRSPGGGHSNPLIFLPRESPWTEETGGLQSMGSQRVGHN